MKAKIAPFVLLFLVLTITTNSQTPTAQRTVMVERFSSANCPYCGANDPILEGYINANANVIGIAYHGYPHDDVMLNAENKPDLLLRQNFYGVSFTPHAEVDGNVFNGNAKSITPSMLSTRQGVASPVMFSNLSCTIKADTVYITFLVGILLDLTGPHNVQIGVIERNVDFTAAPGNNGLKHFEWVMRKMIPSASGTALPNQLSKGQSIAITQMWKTKNIFKTSELRAVVFVQNTSTKEIYQSALSNAAITSEKSITGNTQGAYTKVVPDIMRKLIHVKYYGEEAAEFFLSDCIGNKIFSSAIPHSGEDILIGTEAFSAGIYFYNIRLASGKTESGKLFLSQ